MRCAGAVLPMRGSKKILKLEQSKSVWGAICEFPLYSWRAQQIRVGRMRSVDFVGNLKGTANPCAGLCGPNFLKREQTEHRAQQIRVGRNLWPDFLEKEQSTGNPGGALSVNFLDTHGEHSKSVWGAICGFRLIIMESTANPCEAHSVARLSWNRAQQIRVGSICGPIILKKNRAQGIREGCYL